MDEVWRWVASGMGTIALAIITVWIKTGHASHMMKIMELQQRITVIEQSRIGNGERIAKLEQGFEGINNWLKMIDEKLSRLIEHHTA